MSDLEGLSNRAMDLLERRGADAAHTLRSAHLSPPDFDPGRRLPPSGLGVGLAVAMLALVALAGAMVVAANRDGTPEVGGVAGPVAELAPLVPTVVPDGLALAEVVPGSGAPGDDDLVLSVAYYAPGGSADPYDGPVLTVVRGRASESVAADWLAVGETVEVAGVEATLDLSGQGPRLSWWVDGVLVGLAGRWLDEAALIEVAEALVVDPDALATSSAWRLLHEADTKLSEHRGVRLLYLGDPASGGVPALSIGWSLPGHRSFDVIRAAHPGDAGCALRSLSGCGARSVEVRGQPGLLWSGPDGVSSSLAWVADDGRVVTIEAWNLDHGDLVGVADGLRLGTWGELDPVGFPAPTPPTASTSVPGPDDPGGAGGHPGRDVQAARSLVGDARLQLRAVVESRGERDQQWPRPAPETPPFDESVTLLGVAVEGWYPGTHELGPAVLDGSLVIDAHPLPAPTNAFAVRGDRLWLQFAPDARAALDELVRVCTERAAACPSGRVALVFQDEVVGIVGLSALAETGSITVEVGSWTRNRAPG